STSYSICLLWIIPYGNYYSIWRTVYFWEWIRWKIGRWENRLSFDWHTYQSTQSTSYSICLLWILPYGNYYSIWRTVYFWEWSRWKIGRWENRWSFSWYTY